MSYEKVGTISLWESTSDNAKAPALRGEIEISEVADEAGLKYSVALWPFEGAANGPKFKGSVEVIND
jgi:hypothetical protein